MLFNSLEFIFLFLPITLIGFFLIGQQGYTRFAIAWLLSASVCFYGWWNPANLPILVSSILFNYWIGLQLSQSQKPPDLQKVLLAIGVFVNLALIGYFKYANFFATTTNQLLNTDVDFGEIILPLGISFFTFQQIGYLVDAYRGETKEKYNLVNYAFFVTFFPQLIAGPIIHHKDIIPQLANKSIYRLNSENLAIGITIFAIGLFKKVVFADGVAIYANQVFLEAGQGVPLTLVEAWVGALAFTLQLYFDFSGYSDMAIGLARMMGIHLPINFNSPYKATSIIEFWRRWHITLSNFLRDYLYIPLGGNRYGKTRRKINLMITMLLGGLWHGAGWTFVFWGGLHGIYLIINHQWRSFRQQVLKHDLSRSNQWSDRLGWLLTFIAVVIGWVIFRAENLDTALTVLQGMGGFHGISLPESLEESLGFLENWGVQFDELMPHISVEIEQVEDVYKVPSIIPMMHVFLLLTLAVSMPNTQQMIDCSPNKAWETVWWQKFQWQPSRRWAVISAIFTTIALLHLTNVSEFLYFEF